MEPVRLVLADDVAQLSGALGRAFEDDPVMTWCFPRAGSAGLARLFRAMIGRVFLREGVVYTAEDLAAGALWAPPGMWPLGWVSQLRLLPSVMPLVGTQLVRAGRWMVQVESIHPKEPHWYLATLGTDPPAQGRGKGSALLAPVLERCDKEGLPAYLESSKESNVPFYSRHGFEVTREISACGAPPVFAMWRPPAS